MAVDQPEQSTAPGGQTERLATAIIRTMTERSLTLGTCESLTGGLVGAALTAVPGASKVYRGGFITYATELKTRLAGVDSALVDEFGVVNEETATQMAVGTLSGLGVQMALSCTGVAGPDPQDGQPVGTVWLALAIDLPGPTHPVLTRPLTLTGDRAQIRTQVVEQSLKMLLDYLSPVD